MMTSKYPILALASAALLSACGGGSDSAPAPPATTTSTYSASLTAIEVARSADHLALDVDGLPVQGATVSITD
jgi:ABC-type glycerol-3-phosphate transport system substrate-binding protein